MADQKFGIRLEVSGGAAVEQGLAAIAQAGERAMATVTQRTDQASQSVQRFARTANDNLAGSGGLAGAFDRLDSRAKTVSRSVGDVAGALQLVGGAGGTAERGLSGARSAINGVADVAATASLALGGAGGAGLLGVLTRFAGVVGIAVTAFTAFQAVMRAVQGSTAQNATSAADLTRAYQTLAQASETAEERQRRLRGEQIAGIEAAARLVQETERLNLTQAQAARSAALARVGNLQGQLSEEERIQGAAGSRVTGVQRGRLEALRNEARAAAEALEQANEAITRAQTGINRAGAQAAIGVANVNNPPAAAAARGSVGGGLSRAEEAAALEASLDRIAADLGQPRVSTQALEAGRRVIDETATSAERYEARVAQLNDLLAQNAIDQETYTRAVAQADAAVAGVTRRTDGYSKSFSVLGDAVSDFATSVALDFSSIGRAAESLARTLANTIFRQAVGNQISSGITGLLSSVLGSGDSGQLSLSKLFASSSAGGGVKGFAEGGRTPVGEWFTVGERGPELMRFDTPGTVLPSGVMPRSGGGSSVTIAVDARGATDPAAIEAAAERGARRAVPYVLDAIRRGGQARAIARAA